MHEIIPLLGVAMFSNPELGATFYRERLVPLYEQWLVSMTGGVHNWPHYVENEWTSFSVTWGANAGVGQYAYLHGRGLDVSQAAEQIGGVLYHGGFDYASRG